MSFWQATKLLVDWLGTKRRLQRRRRRRRLTLKKRTMCEKEEKPEEVFASYGWNLPPCVCTCVCACVLLCASEDFPFTPSKSQPEFWVINKFVQSSRGKTFLLPPLPSSWGSSCAAAENLYLCLCLSPSPSSSWLPSLRPASPPQFRVFSFPYKCKTEAESNWSNWFSYCIKIYT